MYVQLSVTLLVKKASLKAVFQSTVYSVYFKTYSLRCVA